MMSTEHARGIRSELCNIKVPESYWFYHPRGGSNRKHASFVGNLMRRLRSVTFPDSETSDDNASETNVECNKATRNKFVRCWERVLDSRRGCYLEDFYVVWERWMKLVEKRYSKIADEEELKRFKHRFYQPLMNDSFLIKQLRTWKPLTFCRRKEHPDLYIQLNGVVNWWQRARESLLKLKALHVKAHKGTLPNYYYACEAKLDGSDEVDPVNVDVGGWYDEESKYYISGELTAIMEECNIDGCDGRPYQSFAITEFVGSDRGGKFGEETIGWDNDENIENAFEYVSDSVSTSPIECSCLQ